LQAVRLLEGFLDWVQVINGSQSFDGGDFVSMRLNGKHQTGADGVPIQQDRTGSADAMLATDVRAGQPKIVTQEVAQQGARLDSLFMARSVDGYSNIE